MLLNHTGADAACIWWVAQVRIRRSRLLESAIKVMEQFAPARTILEIEYYDEIGVGLVRRRADLLA